MRKSQQHAAQFILDNKKCALHLAVGFGKTRATIHALENLIKQKDRSILIVAPHLVIYHTWPYELKKWGLKINTILMAQTREKRKKQLSDPIDGSSITLCNVEKLTWLIAYWSQRGEWPYNTIVLDESSLFKNGSSERFKALKCVIPYTDRIIELTGTPMPKDAMDLWSQIYILDNGARLGKYKTHYQRNFLQPDLRTYSAKMLQRSRGIVRKWEFAKGKKDRVLNTISDICFSLKPEDVDYPDVNMKTISLDLNKTSLDAYKKLSSDYILQVKESNQDPMEVIIKTQGVLNGKLRHVCNGALYDTEQNIIHLHEQKSDRVKEIIGTEGNFLLAYHFKSDWDQIKNKIKFARHIKEDGAIDEWNRGGIKLLCAQVQSASHGLNLQTGGSNIIWFGVNYDLERYEQFNGRLCRPGQRDPVNIYHIIMKYPAGSIEQDIIELLEIRKTEQISVTDYITKRTLERLENGNL